MFMLPPFGLWLWLFFSRCRVSLSFTIFFIHFASHFLYAHVHYVWEYCNNDIIELNNAYEFHTIKWCDMKRYFISKYILYIYTELNQDNHVGYRFCCCYLCTHRWWQYDRYTLWFYLEELFIFLLYACNHINQSKLVQQ